MWGRSGTTCHIMKSNFSGLVSVYSNKNEGQALNSEFVSDIACTIPALHGAWRHRHCCVAFVDREESSIRVDKMLADFGRQAGAKFWECSDYWDIFRRVYSHVMHLDTHG